MISREIGEYAVWGIGFGMVALAWWQDRHITMEGTFEVLRVHQRQMHGERPHDTGKGDHHRRFQLSLCRLPPAPATEAKYSLATAKHGIA